MIINSKKSSFKSADDKLIEFIEYKPQDNIYSSIILVYEIFGMTNHIKNFGKSLAKKGFLVQIPDIFSRLEQDAVFDYNQEGLKKGLKCKEKLGWELPIMDIVSCASQLKLEYNVSCIGFCYGGSLSWIAAQKSFIFNASVCYYGSSIPDFLDKDLNCPAQVHFGKEDKGIPEFAVKKVKEFAKKQRIKVDICEYNNADHGFNCDERKSYNKDASEKSIEKTIQFLMENNNV